MGVWIAVPARICTLYVTTDLRELRDGRRPSVFGESDCGGGAPACSSAVGLVEASSYISIVCSSFVISDMTLASSSRLVGGVEMGGDALDVARALADWIALVDGMDDTDMGEPSRAAMVDKESPSRSRGRYFAAGDGSDAQRRLPVSRALLEQQCQRTRVLGAHALPRKCRWVNQACTEVRANATVMATWSEVERGLRGGSKEDWFTHPGKHIH